MPSTSEQQRQHTRRESEQRCRNKVKTLEDTMDGYSLNMIKMVWAYTLGFVAERRHGGVAGEINLPMQCRNLRWGLGDVALVETNSSPFGIYNNAKRKRERRKLYYVSRIIALATSNGPRAACATLDSVLKYCDCIYLYETQHMENIFTLQCHLNRIYERNSTKLSPCHTHLALMAFLRQSEIVETGGGSAFGGSELNFPYHGELTPEAWKLSTGRNASNAEYRDSLEGTRFAHAAWECCPPVALNARLMYLQAGDSGNYLVKLRRECIAMLCAWMEDHLDTKNFILATSFLLGMLASRQPRIFSTYDSDLIHMFLFSQETEKTHKEFYETYRGPRVKKHLAALHKQRFFPLLSIRGLVNVYNFCHEIRFSLAQFGIRKQASRHVFEHLSAFVRGEHVPSPELRNGIRHTLNYDVYRFLTLWPPASATRL